jgi:hypothetical protein
MNNREAINLLEDWSKQFSNIPDSERVTIRVGDLKVFTKICIDLLKLVAKDERHLTLIK